MILESKAMGGHRAFATVASLTALLAGSAIATSSCSGTSVLPESEPSGPTLGPAEVCYTPNAMLVEIRMEPRFLVLAPGQTRAVRVVVDPDFCTTTPVTFTSSNPEVLASPADNSVTYGSPSIALSFTGDEIGTTTVTATVPRGDDTEATATLEIDVLAPTLPTCESADDTSPKLLEAGATIAGQSSLAAASLSLPARADDPISPSITWPVNAFEAAIECAADITPAGYEALGPAIRFTPAERSFPRDLPMTIPINPARMPEAARWRHLQVAYSGPRFVEPRTILATNPKVTKVDGQWQLSFMAPQLGTYQAVVDPKAGTHTRMRRITHRALVGVSMGAAGAAQFGLRHHRLFDVVAPLGGPVDLTWLVDHVEHNQLAGFRPIAPGTQLQDIQIEKTTCTTDQECQPDERCIGVIDDPPFSGRCTFMPATDEPYEHATTFNNWWSEGPQLGNGGNFDRRDYTQIFRDLVLAFGNPFSFNPLQLNLPAGVDPEHPSQTGDHENGECKTWVKPYDHPDDDEMSAIANSCPAERCQYTQVLQNYYDDEFNPDGTFDVITFCDGSNKKLPGSTEDFPFAPYQSSWWADEANNHPIELVLAVDYNGNGVRDELEPVITSGHEPWDDWGEDQTPSIIEPGYGPDNLDPSGDDYDPRYNPTGTEGDRRYQSGEPFRDYGLDGVDGTASSPYDYGEGDGTFTMSAGLEGFHRYDPHSLVRGLSDIHSTPLDDDALARLDVWLDGGNRDLFNSYPTAQHLAGTFLARGRDTVALSDFNQVPGLNPDTPELFAPAEVVWDDLQGIVLLRYGRDDPTQTEYDNGTGMHVGTVNEILQRLQLAMYFMASRWPDAPRAQVEVAQDNPAEGIDNCVIANNCTFDFTSSFGRSGPVALTLPPGYGHADLQDERYPVIYVMHGYGMTPEDLQVTIAFISNWMNGSMYSQLTRLSKAILVYVDGRCRWQEGKTAEHRAECLRGTFYADSVRPEGPQMDAWLLELMDHIDQSYRTMGETTIEWTD